ncbi:unnamed protein product [Cuscuta epithymum]|uniref:Uncharacterized protein n=1 Tax=Cuscuta epithymum TaxID=186058 RepID=A0AAV0D5C2_9ASTE|nr:unnamed protein product [Cuscuta epithymum]
MENLRSKSTREGGNWRQPSGFPPTSSMNDFRSYSTSSYAANNNNENDKVKRNTAKRSKSKVVVSPLSSQSFREAEEQRKKRVESYRAFAKDGKVKGSFRWIKAHLFSACRC